MEQSRGVPRHILNKIIEYFSDKYSYDEIIHLLKKGYNFSLSLSKLKRLFKAIGFQRKNIIESSAEKILLACLLEIKDAGADLGYKGMWHRLTRLYKLKVKQKTVLAALRVVDPAGVAARFRRRLKRRKYGVPGPNFLWHIDGYDKIKRFGFAIHGCIDGYSKRVIWLHVASTNNDPNVIAFYYLILPEHSKKIRVSASNCKVGLRDGNSCRRRFSKTFTLRTL